MTGGEILPAAKIAASAAKKVVSDADDRSMLQKVAADSPSIKAAAESYARRVVIKEAILLRLYQPIGRLLGASREYFDTDFQTDMANKLADTPEEFLTTPPPSVAIPAMEGLMYSVSEPDLKEMYLNLLATATDERTKANAHPSFADIIKQLSPREARLLLDCLTTMLPLVRLTWSHPKEAGESQAANHLLSLTALDQPDQQVEEPLLAVWIDNWCRLGLVEADYIRSLVENSRYDWVESNPVYERLALADPPGGESLKVQRGLLRPTDFGERFRAAVSFDGVPLTGAPGLPQDPPKPVTLADSQGEPKSEA
jgi:hypothetical protein